MVWYGMVWYGMVWYGSVNSRRCPLTVSTIPLRQSGEMQETWQQTAEAEAELMIPTRSHIDLPIKKKTIKTVQDPRHYKKYNFMIYDSLA